MLLYLWVLNLCLCCHSWAFQQTLTEYSLVLMYMPKEKPYKLNCYVNAWSLIENKNGTLYTHLLPHIFCHINRRLPRKIVEILLALNTSSTTRGVGVDVKRELDLDPFDWRDLIQIPWGKRRQNIWKGAEKRLFTYTVMTDLSDVSGKSFVVSQLRIRCQPHDKITLSG